MFSICFLKLTVELPEVNFYFEDLHCFKLYFLFPLFYTPVGLQRLYFEGYAGTARSCGALYFFFMPVAVQSSSYKIT